MIHWLDVAFDAYGDDIWTGSEILSKIFGESVASGYGLGQRDLTFRRESPFTELEIEEAKQRFQKASLRPPSFHQRSGETGE